MALVEFTEYRPNGRQEQQHLELPDDVAAIAKQIAANGFRFEAEMLMTGHVSLTIADPVIEEDVAIELFRNGPEIHARAEKMIREFDMARALAERAKGATDAE